MPFALAAGLSSLGESKIVVLGGIAELIAGAISMGIGGFLASQAERDHYRYLRRMTKARVLRSCDGEMEREVHTVLGAVGVDEKVSRQVAHNLLEVESAVERDDALLDEERGLRWSQSVGITEFLLKFGEGLGASPLPMICVLCNWTHVRSVCRGGTHTAPLRVCLHDRHGLLVGWRDSFDSVFLHSNGPHCAHVLVPLHRDRATRLRCCQGENHGCGG